MPTKKKSDSPDSAAAAKALAEMIPSPEQATAIAPEKKASAPAKAKPPADKKLPATELESPQDLPRLGLADAPPRMTSEEPDPPPRRRTKRKTPARANGASSSAAKKKLQRMLPAGVQLALYKNDRGKQSYVNHYSANDLLASGSLEAFLTEYVIPEYGYGEYFAYFQEPGKEMQSAGSANIAEPASAKARRANGGGSTVELMELMLKQQESARQAAAERKSPMEEMREMLGFFQTMTGANEEKKPAMDPMMMLMLMQMNQKPEVPKGPDPVMLKIIEKLDRMEDERSAMNMLPPPPPPPQPQVDPMEGFAKMMAVMQQQQADSTKALLTILATNKNDRSPIEEYATLMKLNGMTDDRLSVKDLVTMLPQFKDMLSPNQGKTSITEALETMRTMKLIEREFSPNGDAQAASSFWDFLRDFVQSDAGTRVAEAIMANERKQEMDQRTAQRRKALEGQQQRQVEEEDEQPDLQIPEPFGEIAQRINTGANAAERLMALVQGFQMFGSYQEWRPYMAKIFGLMKLNQKMECIDFVGTFLEGLVDAGALEEKAAQRALDDLDAQWAIVRQQLKMPDIPEVYPDGYEPEETEDAPSEPQARVQTTPEVDDDEPEEVDPPRTRARNPERDRAPLEPTPEQLEARRQLEEARQREAESVPAS